MELLNLLSEYWFLLTTFAFLVAGWVRFEQVQKRAAAKDEEHERKLGELEIKLNTEVERMSKNTNKISKLTTDIDWVKASLSRLETTMNTFIGIKNQS